MFTFILLLCLTGLIGSFGVLHGKRQSVGEFIGLTLLVIASCCISGAIVYGIYKALSGN